MPRCVKGQKRVNVGRKLTTRQRHQLLSAILSRGRACWIGRVGMDRYAPAQIRQGEGHLSVTPVPVTDQAEQRRILFDVEDGAITNPPPAGHSAGVGKEPELTKPIVGQATLQIQKRISPIKVGTYVKPCFRMDNIFLL